MRKMSTIVVAVLLTVGVVLPCFSGGAQDKGAKPNELNLLLFEGYGEPGWVDPFEAETGAKINITNATSVDEIFSKMVADKGRGFDLVTLDTSQFPRYHQQGLLLPINTDNIPNYRKELLPEFHDLKETTLGYYPHVVRHGRDPRGAGLLARDVGFRIQGPGHRAR
jgi:spermidine/putrescine-binding protein